MARAIARIQPDARIDLTESNPTTAGLAGDPTPVARAIDAGRADRYEPAPFGLPAARASAARWMTQNAAVVEPARVVLTASTSEAYAFAFKLLCDPGDEVLVPRPSYPLFEHLTRLEGVRAVPYPLRYDGRWHVSVAELERARTDRTRAVLLVHPNNPTGSLFSRAELEAIGRLGLPLVSDEVFAGYRHAGCDDAPRSALELAGDGLVFALQGLSKQAALPQLKLSWISVGGAPERVEEALARMELIADSYLSVATPVQQALGTILEAADGARAHVRERLRENLAALDARVEGCPPVDRLQLDAGWYATLRLPAVLDDEGWALELAQRDGVLVQPGYFYDFEGGPYLVVSLLTDPQRFVAGLERVLARVDAVLSTSTVER